MGVSASVVFTTTSTVAPFQSTPSRNFPSGLLMLFYLNLYFSAFSQVFRFGKNLQVPRKVWTALCQRDDVINVMFDASFFCQTTSVFVAVFDHKFLDLGAKPFFHTTPSGIDGCGLLACIKFIPDLRSFSSKLFTFWILATLRAVGINMLLVAFLPCHVGRTGFLAFSRDYPSTDAPPRYPKSRRDLPLCHSTCCGDLDPSPH